MGTQQESVAVIGASGFIGQALCCQLLAQGYKVHAVGRSKAHLQAIFEEWQADIQLHDYSMIVLSLCKSNAWPGMLPEGFLAFR